MSIIFIEEVRFICRLDPAGHTVLNPYTPIAFN